MTSGGFVTYVTYFGRTNPMTRVLAHPISDRDHVFDPSYFAATLVVTVAE